MTRHPGGDCCEGVVSLRTCSDCGENVSSSASACPHCGRPRRKSHPAFFETGALFGLAIIGLAALAWHSGLIDNTAGDSVRRISSSETAIARPYRQLQQSLTAYVAYNRTLHLLRVENRDAFAWTHCQLSLNLHGISGYDLEVESIKPGLLEAALLQSAEFADPDGKRFDPSNDRVATLDLRCETPDGHLYYGGKFATDDSRSVAARQNKSATTSHIPG
jgi:hypothetical protein